MIWFTLEDGDSVAVAPEHVRYVRPTDEGTTILYFSRDDRLEVALPSTEVVAKIDEALGRA
ncbi:hypothetical protein [Sphingosinicella terrae]|jgi:hypothetical protein|uniref:hypothetical protein n=1 Tax=Sphingosinicella terrae TaxID=2172047 RepID=UPI000E0DF247|nr:hypothetical protein [Sphingosinicella terrae]